MLSSYGPWTVHTPGECPVPPETMVQVQLRKDSQVYAEADEAQPAKELRWSEVKDCTIAYYRVLLEPEWRIVSYWRGDNREWKILAPFIDGKPDFSRQPKWEDV